MSILIKGMAMPESCLEYPFKWAGDSTTYCLAQTPTMKSLMPVKLHEIRWKKVSFIPVITNANQKPMTNADRIRSMTDEELAFYIVNHPMWSDESACIAWLKESISGERK